MDQWSRLFAKRLLTRVASKSQMQQYIFDIEKRTGINSETTCKFSLIIQVGNN